MITKEEKEQIKQDIAIRVEWWLKDMAFKPPEINWDHYYKCMIADIAAYPFDDDPEYTAMDRLDP